MTTIVDDSLQAITRLCQEYEVEELSVFGSSVRDDFGPDSDVDFVVVFKDDDYGPFLSKLMDFEEALSAAIGRPVDLVTRRSVEQSDNYIRREHILSSLRTVYVAG